MHLQFLMVSIFCHPSIYEEGLGCLYSGCDMESENLLLQHLKEDMKLSYLAQELQSIDRLAPQTWYFLIDPVTMNWLFYMFVI